MTGLRIEDVSVMLGGDTAVDDVTLELEDGELLGVVGPNGAGKTTLLRCMNGALEPDSGSVYLEGDRLRNLGRDAVARQVATLPQDTSISFDFTVEEVVRMGRHPWTPRFGTDPEPEKVDEAMKTTDVRRFADRKIEDVSGGERQRVLLARCLAQDASTLLLDEPTASLDIHRAVEVMEMVRGLVDDGHTAVAALHDLDLAARYVDRLALLDDGDLRVIGDPSEVVASTVLEEVYGGTVAAESEGLPRVEAFDRTGDLDPARLHVVGNGARQIQVIEGLWRTGHTVTAGAVSRQDPYASALDALTSEVVFEDPYSPVSDDSRRRVRELVDQASAVVVAPTSVAEGFVPALEAVADVSELYVASVDDLSDHERQRIQDALGGGEEELGASAGELLAGSLTQV